MPRRRLLLVLAVILAAALYGVLDVRQRARLDRGLRHHRTDFTVYQAAARALEQGTDPYEAESPRGYRYVYPPLFAVLLLPVADWEAPDAALAFYVVSLLALGAAVACVARVPAPSVPGTIGMRAALVGALCCLPFLHQSFERGQITIVLLALEAGALLALVRERHFTGGLLLGLGGALRLTPLLPALAVLCGALAARRRRKALRCAAGLAVAVAVGFALVPAAALGPTRAVEVTREWVAAAGGLFASRPGELEPLERVNEYRFKNQAPRRVLATWTGWLAGAPFADERPELSAEAWRAVDLAAYGIAAALGLLALWIGARRLGDPRAETFGAAFAALLMLPLGISRYGWPTHWVDALPAAALAFSGAPGRRLSPRGLAVFIAGTVLFYLCHLRSLEALGAAGPLLAGGAVLTAGLLLGARPSTAKSGAMANP